MSFMTDADEGEEVSKYAPKWAREGTAWPRTSKMRNQFNLVHFPDAPQLVVPDNEYPPAPRDLDERPSPYGDHVLANDLALRKLLQRRALEPQLVPLPPKVETHSTITIGMILRLLFAISAAAVIALFVVGASPHKMLELLKNEFFGAEEEHKISVGSAPAPIVNAEVIESQTQARSDKREGNNETVSLSEEELQRVTKPISVATQTISVNGTQNILTPVNGSSAKPLETSSIDSSEQNVDPEEVRQWTKRGEEFLSQGDIASARLMLRRAAEAGNMKAALLLAGTYDPFILRQLRVIGFEPDIAQARKWYQAAAAEGVVEASRRLAELQER